MIKTTEPFKTLTMKSIVVWKLSLPVVFIRRYIKYEINY